MSSAYRILDRRGMNNGAPKNDLYEASVPKNARKRVTPMDRDTHLLAGGTARTNLMTYGRWLFANFPSVHGMVLEQANLAVGSWIPQFAGKDLAWGKVAEEWLYQWHKICDFRGQPFDYNTFVQFCVIASIRCGDLGVHLTTGPSDYPFVQLIPAHRIGSRANERVVTGGRYDGARMIDGVIVNSYAQAVAYRVWSDYAGQGTHRDISSRDMALVFFPEWPDQVRGISGLAAGINDWQDVAETRWNELIAQKAAAAIALIETNESGEANTAKTVIRTKETTNGDNAEMQAPAYEEMAGGTVRYFRVNTGSNITTLQHQRPGFAAIEFLNACMRDAFQAAEWDYYFSVDPSKVGGASMRVIVDRINRVIKKRRAMVEKICRRVDGWALSKAVNLGLIPANDEWYEWTYQGPADVTADRKYDSDVDLQEWNAGFRTLQDICARRNLWWEEVQDQRLEEEKRELKAREEAGLPPKVAPGQEASPEPNRNRREPKEPNQEGPADE